MCTEKKDREVFSRSLLLGHMKLGHWSVTVSGEGASWVLLPASGDYTAVFSKLHIEGSDE